MNKQKYSYNGFGIVEISTDGDGMIVHKAWIWGRAEGKKEKGRNKKCRFISSFSTVFHFITKEMSCLF